MNVVPSVAPQTLVKTNFPLKEPLEKIYKVTEIIQHVGGDSIVPYSMPILCNQLLLDPYTYRNYDTFNRSPTSIADREEAILNNNFDTIDTYEDGTIQIYNFHNTQQFLTSMNEDMWNQFSITDLYLPPNFFDIKYEYCAYRAASVQNAGGKSELSEMLSIHYFQQIFGATNILLEMEIEYWIDYKMVDFVCNINNNRIGVSVTRAMGYPNSLKFTYDDAIALLNKKLFGLIISRNSVVKSQTFFKSVLHVWCQNHRIANLLEEAYATINLEDYGLKVKGSVIVLLTVCSDPFIYTNEPDGIKPEKPRRSLFE